MLIGSFFGRRRRTRTTEIKSNHEIVIICSTKCDKYAPLLSKNDRQSTCLTHINGTVLLKKIDEKHISTCTYLLFLGGSSAWLRRAIMSDIKKIVESLKFCCSLCCCTVSIFAILPVTNSRCDLPLVSSSSSSFCFCCAKRVDI